MKILLPGLRSFGRLLACGLLIGSCAVCAVASGVDVGIDGYTGDLPITSASIYPATYSWLTNLNNRPLAVVRGTTSVSAILDFSSAYSSPRTITVGYKGTLTDSVTGKTYTITSPPQQITVPAKPAEIQAPFPLSGFPNTVSIGYLQAIPTGFGFDGAELDCTTYVVDQAPSTPMSPVWDNVVAATCTCCDGLTGNSIEPACTKTIYWSGQITYNGGGATSYYEVSGQPVGSYALKKLTTDFSNGGVTMDCRDVSGLLGIYLASQGHQTTLTQMWPSPRNVFKTTPICAIGYSQSNYVKTPWNFHQIDLSSAGVYDACAAQFYDLSGNVYKQVALGWGEQAYWQSPNSLGLVYGWASAPNTPATITLSPVGKTLMGVY